MTSIKNSTATALFTLGFFVSLLFTSLSTPDVYYAFIFGGIVISAAMTVFYWRKERKTTKTLPIGIWIILTILLLFIVLLILPLLPGYF